MPEHVAEIDETLMWLQSRLQGLIEEAHSAVVLYLSSQGQGLLVISFCGLQFALVLECSANVDQHNRGISLSPSSRNAVSACSHMMRRTPGIALRRQNQRHVVEETGEIRAAANASDMAAMLIATIQGAYVLASAAEAPEPFHRAIRGALGLLR